MTLHFLMNNGDLLTRGESEFTYSLLKKLDTIDRKVVSILMYNEKTKSWETFTRDEIVDGKRPQ